jgi:uncharacterized protein YbjT (DUF2867 family)
MAGRKIIAVVGATGAQGSGLVQSILADPAGPYAVRAITRDSNSQAARALAAAGAEVVAADIDDAASVRRAFAGAHGAYCVTFFWAHMSPERELAEARVMAEAARDCGLRHVIWSTLEDSRRFVPLDDARMPTLMGRYKVPHFDAKGEADQYFRECGVPTTFLLTSFYYDNLISFGMGPKRSLHGKLVFAMPLGDSRFPSIAAADIGRCAHGIFKREGEFTGRAVGIAGSHLTGAEMAAALARAYREEVRYEAVPFDVYRGLGFPGADDLGNMFQFNCEFAADFCAARSVEFSRSLNPALQTFDDWLAANVQRIPTG